RCYVDTAVFGYRDRSCALERQLELAIGSGAWRREWRRGGIGVAHFPELAEKLRWHVAAVRDVVFGDHAVTACSELVCYCFSVYSRFDVSARAVLVCMVSRHDAVPLTFYAFTGGGSVGFRIWLSLRFLV